MISKRKVEYTMSTLIYFVQYMVCANYYSRDADIGDHSGFNSNTAVSSRRWETSDAIEDGVNRATFCTYVAN